jgi:molecular chaperone GrpE
LTEKHHKKAKNSSDEIKVKIEEPGKESPATGDGNERAKEPLPVEKPERQLEEKTREAAENFDKWLRSVAELENFKKRAQKEKADLLKFSNESLLKALLPVLDNLERAVTHGHQAGEKSPLLEGVEITLKQFLSTLEKFGVRPISAAGEVFDPEKHEAVMQQEAEGEPNRVVSELEKGYFYQDRLLRPSKVIVSKARE